MFNPFAWIAEKLAGPVLAFAGVLALVGFSIQTVRLDGVHIFGLAIVEGALDREGAAIEDAYEARTAMAVYKSASDTCNASVDRLAKATVDLGRDMDSRFALLAPALSQMNANAAHILGLKPAAGQDKCDFAFQILKGKVQ